MVFTLDETFDAMAKMKVVGIGGAGGNAVNRMVTEGLKGVEFISVNTDAMALDNNRATHRIQIGEKITKGLGAGANPEIGRAALEEDRDRVAGLLEGSDMVFITAGMGGGTGTGGAPVVAEIAKEMGILTVAIVTRPFLFEGKVRDRNGKKGIDELRRNCDTIIVIPNQKLLSIVDRNTSLIDAFRTADEVLYQATKGISDLISGHGLVNLDFADVRTVMLGMGDAIMGSGVCEGDNRAALAADAAIHSPLLDDVSIAGARGILINITGGEDMTLYDVSDATQAIHEAVGEDADCNIIFGAVIDPEMSGRIQVTVIATGFNEATVRDNSFTAPKVSVKLPGRNMPEEKRVQQMAIDLPAGKAAAAREQQARQQAQQQQAPQIQQPAAPAQSPAPRQEQPQRPVQPEDGPVHVEIDDDDHVPADAPGTVEEEKAPGSGPMMMQNHEEPRAAEPGHASHEEDMAPRPAQQQGASKDGEQDGSHLEIPVVFRKDNVQKEQIFVSKGQVITQLEDDMDIPTFLRKQMQ